MNVKKYTKHILKLILIITILFAAYKVENLYSYSTIAKQYTAEELEGFRINAQITNDILAEAKIIQNSKGIKSRKINQNITPRRHRHLWYKAHLTLCKIETSCVLITPAKNNTIPANRDIHSEDIRDILQKSLESIRALKKNANIIQTQKPSALPTRALPADIYKNLEEVDAIMSRINTLTIEPKHVYVIADTIIKTLRKISTTDKITGKTKNISGKHPRDVYNQAYILMKIFKDFVDNNDAHKTSIKIIMLKKKSGQIVPADVFNLLLNILADVEDVAIASGHTPIKINMFDLPHRTPSNVFEKVTESITLLNKMQNQAQ